MLVRDIVERSSGSSSQPLPPQPSSSSSGFPTVQHRSLRPKPVSAFARAKKEEETRKAGGRVLGEGRIVESIPVVQFAAGRNEVEEVRKSVEAENARRVEDMGEEERQEEARELKERFGVGVVDVLRRRREARNARTEGPSTSRSEAIRILDDPHRLLDEVSADNARKVEQMNDQEREEEKQELEERFGNGLAEMFRKRRESKLGRGSETTVTSEANLIPTAPVDPLPIPPRQPSDTSLPSLIDDNPSPSLSAMHQKYFPDQVPETAKLEWLTPPAGSTSPVDTAPRFDLSGRELSSAAMADLPSHLGLHHHGASPDLAGYKLEDILHLCRSTVTSQRITMMGVLAKIISGEKDLTSEGKEEAFKLKIVEMGIDLGVEVLLGSLKGLGIVRAGIDLLFEALGGSSWDWIEHFDNGCELAPRKFQPDSAHLEAVPFEDLIPRLTHLFSSEILSARSTRQLLLIVHRAALYSQEAAETICPLLPIIIRHHVLLQPWPRDPASPPSREALSLLNTVVISSRPCAEALLQQNVVEPLLKFLVVSTWTSALPLSVDVLRIFYALGKYGLLSSTATSAGEVWRGLGRWVSNHITSTRFEETEVVRAYFDCLGIWTICAIDPHRTTPEHDLTWAQMSAMRWVDEALSAVMALVHNDDPNHLLPSVLGFLVVWIEGAEINGVNRGEREKKEVYQGLSEATLPARIDIHTPNDDLLAYVRLARLSPEGSKEEWSIDRGLYETLSQSSSASLPLQYELLRLGHCEKLVDPSTWSARISSLLPQLQPGYEPLALQLVDDLLQASWDPSLLAPLTYRDGLQILRPLLHHAVLPDVENVVGPIPPSHLYLKVTSTLRVLAETSTQSPGLPLQSDWIFSPLDELLCSGSSLAFSQAPADWDPSEIDIVRATLTLARLLSLPSTSPLPRSTILLNLMKVYMLEHGQNQQATSESEVFRDTVISDLLKTLLVPISQPLSTPLSLDAELEKTALPFLGEGVPFYQFYVDFLALYEAISFSDATFGRLLLPPLAMTYPKDYRKLLWSDQPTALRTLKIDMKNVPLESGSIRPFFEPAEDDADILSGYTRALIRGWVSEKTTEFLFKIAIHHLATLFWFTKDRARDSPRVSLLVAILGTAPDAAVKSILDHDVMFVGNDGGITKEEQVRRLELVKELTGQRGLQKVESLRWI
ncbi:RNA polymerase II-associated protein 1, partial [Tremellales sp. Uapishka_1]